VCHLLEGNMSSRLSAPLLQKKDESNDESTKTIKDLEDGESSPFFPAFQYGKGSKDEELPKELTSVHQGHSSFRSATINTTALLFGE
jgi:hypothetical protein